MKCLTGAAMLPKRVGLPRTRPAHSSRSAGCTIRGDATVRLAMPEAETATEADWETEYLAPIIAVKVVENLDDAIAHINRHGSHHTEAIITEDAAAAVRFMNEIDAGIVMHNASTQFADGGRSEEHTSELQSLMR